MSPNNRIRKARRARTGAAMVEGIVAITTMLGFLGLIVWTRQAYGMKLDLQQQTRSDTLYFASHGCSGGGGGAGEEGGGAIGVDSPNVGGAPGDGAQAAQATRSWNNAAASDSRSVTWQAVFDQNARGGQGGSIQLSKQQLTSNVSASSNCTCNEPKYDSQLTAWLKFGKDMVQRGGGFADLFK